MLPDPEHTAQTLTIDARSAAAEAVLQRVLIDKVVGRAAVVSSFGAESAVLLHMVSRIDRQAPVLFIDTQMLFEETLDYHQTLSRHLGLSNVTQLSPDPVTARRDDVFGRLHKSDPDKCCALRKVAPLHDGLKGYAAWVSGRKRFQTTARANLPLYEAADDGRIKVNPLADWTADNLQAYFDRHHLPRHPLASAGFTSIGCGPCTQPPGNNRDMRSGRWAGSSKTECGIHIAAAG